MGKAALVEQDISAGEALIRRLDDSDIGVNAALWYLSPESGEWRLVIGTPAVDKKGARNAYKRIRSILQASSSEPSPSASKLTLQDISVVSPTKSPLIRLLSSALTTGKGISGIRFTNNVVHGTLIEDAYIYRLA